MIISDGFQGDFLAGEGEEKQDKGMQQGEEMLQLIVNFQKKLATPVHLSLCFLKIHGIFTHEGSGRNKHLFSQGLLGRFKCTEHHLVLFCRARLVLNCPGTLSTTWKTSS